MVHVEHDVNPSYGIKTSAPKCVAGKASLVAAQLAYQLIVGSLPTLFTGCILLISGTYSLSLDDNKVPIVLGGYRSDTESGIDAR